MCEVLFVSVVMSKGERFFFDGERKGKEKEKKDDERMSLLAQNQRKRDPRASKALRAFALWRKQG